MPRKKPGPGHPVTTGMAATPPVHYRVTADQRAELDRVVRAFVNQYESEDDGGPAELWLDETEGK